MFQTSCMHAFHFTYRFSWYVMLREEISWQRADTNTMRLTLLMEACLVFFCLLWSGHFILAASILCFSWRLCRTQLKAMARFLKFQCTITFPELLTLIKTSQAVFSIPIGFKAHKATESRTIYHTVPGLFAESNLRNDHVSTGGGWERTARLWSPSQSHCECVFADAVVGGRGQRS